MFRSLTRVLLVGLCVAACGSNGLSSAAAGLHEGEDADLTDCTPLGKVAGAASEDDKNAATHAKNDAREKAAALGATHLRWIIPCCTTVEAQAYRCDLPER
jgi:hypothetical protein